MTSGERMEEIAIIGGGLAGSSAACVLARAGRPVLLIERTAEPHHKVCGEFLSIEAQAYLADLQYLRDGARAVSATPQISDAQFSSFMSGIREGIDTPVRGHWLWAKVSLVAAALVVSISLFVILESKNVVQPPVTNAGSKVESASSEIRDVTVKTETSDDGSVVLWMTPKPEPRTTDQTRQRYPTPPRSRQPARIHGQARIY